MHKLGFKICYNRKAIVFTQDPSTLYSYVNQMRRWFGGGWQNLLKHSDITLSRPSRALELSLMYIEGLVFSALLFVVPLFSLRFAVTLALPCLAIAILFAVYAAIKERRADLVLAPFPYMFLMYVNSYVFLEQFVKEVLLQKKNLTWFNPQRVQIEQKN
jgi:cellulose synthase/poly-beta-1,6-N-acetylglucosamine synthase-like glycosyltransferase